MSCRLPHNCQALDDPLAEPRRVLHHRLHRSKQFGSRLPVLADVVHQAEHAWNALDLGGFRRKLEVADAAARPAAELTATLAALGNPLLTDAPVVEGGEVT